MRAELGFVFAAGLLAAATATHAADPATVQQPSPPADDSGDGAGGLFPPMDWIAGGLLSVAPVYEGSDVYEVIPIPLIYPQLEDTGEPRRLNFRGVDDIRYTLFRPSPFAFGPVVGWNFGRDDSDASLIKGIGDIDGGLVLGVFGGFNFDPFVLDVAYATKVTGDDTGYEIRFNAGAEKRVTDRLTAAAYVFSEFVDDDYADAYFSITPAQSGASGLPVYDADAGIKNVGVKIGFEYDLTDRWSAQIGGSYSRLVGDIADSPVVADKNQFSALFGVTYRFGHVNDPK